MITLYIATSIIDNFPETENVLAIINALIALVTAIGVAGVAWRQGSNRKTLKEIGATQKEIASAVNGQSEKLIATTAKAAKAEGRLEATTEIAALALQNGEKE